jgi:hypothetical protein
MIEFEDATLEHLLAIRAGMDKLRADVRNMKAHLVAKTNRATIQLNSSALPHSKSTPGAPDYTLVPFTEIDLCSNRCDKLSCCFA